MSPETIGIIGLGLMGSAIAQTLIRHGFIVRGFDRLPARVAEAESFGLLPDRSAARTAQQSSILLLSLYDSDSVRQVIESVHAELRPGQIILDTTTGDAASASETATLLAAMQIHYLDATISGNRDQLLQHQATIMAGGAREAFDRCRTILDCLGKHVFHLGPAGSGARMKLVTNLALGLHRAVLAETLVFAKALGIEPSAALEVLRASPASSRIMDAKGEKMISGDFTPQARLSQHLKDVRLINDAGHGLLMPLSRVHQQLLEQAEAAGLGELDNSAIIRVLEQASADSPPPST